MSASVDSLELVTLAERAARAAGALLSSLVAERDALAADARQKSSLTDLVTAADLETEKLILEMILEERPDDGIIAEEGSGGAGRSGVTWIVDPLDGTINFIYGYGSFAVSIAATSDDGALAGVVYDPLRDECFTARKGSGAALNGYAIATRRAPSLPLSLVGTGFGYGSERRAAQALVLPGLLPRVRDIRRGGSAALDLCSLAIGRLDAYYEAGLGPWDRAAGLLIATEAGCTFVEIDGLVPEVETLVASREPLLGELASLLVDLAPQGAAQRQQKDAVEERR